MTGFILWLQISIVVAFGAAAVLGICGLLGWRQVLASWRDTPTWGRVILVLLVAVQALLVFGLVPEGPWHAFHHDVERWATLRDGAPYDDLVGSAQHGAAGYALQHLLFRVLSDPFLADGFLSIAATAVSYGVARRRVGVGAALLITAIYALLPIRLRVSTSLQLYVPGELTLLIALLAASVELELRSWRSFLPAAIALAFAMTAHTEYLLVAPVAALAWVLSADPSWARTAVRRIDVWVGVALIAALLAPRLMVIATAPPSLMAALPSVTPGSVREPLIGALAALTLLVMLPPPSPTPPWARRALGAAALGLAALGLASVGAGMFTPFVGNARFPGLLTGWRSTLAVLNPEMTPPAWVGLALLGMIGGWLTRPTLVRALAPVLLAVAWLHGGHHDSISTLVRIGLVGAWPFAALAGAGLSLAAALLPRRRTGALLIVPALAILPYLSWIGWRYPEQREFDALRLARAHLAAGGALVMPTAADLPADLEAKGFSPKGDRGYLQVAVGKGQVMSVTEALALPSLPADTWLLWPLGCHETYIARGQGPRRVWQDGRVWQTDVEAPPERPDAYVDPSCAAFAARYTLVPQLEEPIAGPTTTAGVVDPRGHVGVYAVGAAR